MQECEMCSEKYHESMDCPWIYSRCKLVPCNGIRKLLKVKDGVNSGKKFLSYSNPMCSYFEWFDGATDAVKSMAPQYKGGCDACAGDHRFADCPWSQTPCINPKCHSTKVRMLNIAQTSWNYGIGYLKCQKCEDFQWVSDAIFVEKQKQLCNSEDRICAQFKDKVKIKCRIRS